jgi:hypothetical protein
VGVGQDLGTLIIANIPEQLREAVQPLVPGIVDAIQEAFSVAVASTFEVGIVTTILAIIGGALMPELPLRSTSGPPRAADRVDGHRPSPR